MPLAGSNRIAVARQSAFTGQRLQVSRAARLASLRPHCMSSARSVHAAGSRSESAHSAQWCQVMR